jgi:hypothetical protein
MRNLVKEPSSKSYMLNDFIVHIWGMTSSWMSYYLRISSNLSYNMTLPYPFSNFLIYAKNFSQFSIKEKKLVLSFRIVPRIVWYISLRHRVNSWLLLRASMRIMDEFATSFALFMLLLAERMKIWKLIFSASSAL